MSDTPRAVFTWRTRLLLSGALYALLAAVVAPQWHSYERLAHTGVQTIGQVLAKEPDNHMSVRYAYRVGGHGYSGSSTASFGGLPPFAVIRVGNQIPVTYLPDRPSVSLPGDPSEVYQSWSGLLFGVMPLVSLGLGLSLGRAQPLFKTLTRARGRAA